MTLPGHGLGLSPVLLIQETLYVGFAVLASERRSMDELFARDDGLRHNTTAEWRKALREALLEMVDPTSPSFCEILPNYPAPGGAARLPVVSIIDEGGGESGTETVAGDLLRKSFEFHGPNQELWSTTEIGAGHRTQLQIGAWALAPEAALALHAAIQWVLYRLKPDLLERGIKEISWTTGKAEPSPELEPRVAMVPMLNLSLNWTFRSSYRKKVPNRVTFRPPRFS